jgi:hypothetical protein
MNKLAAVLAADSATTVSQWINNREERRYFKGANKIFQLSRNGQVGIMIYNAAEILDVPWQVAIKEYRQTNGTMVFNTLAEYADEFIGFLASNSRMFPPDIRREYFQQRIVLQALKPIFTGMTEDGEIDPDKARQCLEYFKDELN